MTRRNSTTNSASTPQERFKRLAHVRRTEAAERKPQSFDVDAQLAALPAAPAPAAHGPGAATNAMEKARIYARSKPAGIGKNGGGDECFALACELAKYGLSEDQVFAVLNEEYGPRCVPPWNDSHELKHKAHDAVQKHEETFAGFSADRRKRSEAARVAPPDAAADGAPDQDRVHNYYEPDDYSEEPLDYLCPTLGFAVGKVNNIEAPWGGAKTPCALSYGIHAADGRPWCGHAFSRPLRTLYLAHEGAGVARRKRARMCRALGIDPKAIPFWIWRGKGAFDAASLTALEAFCREQGIDQIIVDTLTSANRASEVSQTDERYAKVLWMLGGMSEELKLAVIVLAHLGKDASRGAAGTYAIDGAAQCIWKLAAGKEPGTFIWTCARAPEEPLAEFAVRIDDVPAPDGTDPKWGLVVELVVDGSATPRDAKAARGAINGNHDTKIKAANQRRDAARALWGEKANGQIIDWASASKVCGDVSGRAITGVLRELVKAGLLKSIGRQRWCWLDTAFKSDAQQRFALAVAGLADGAE